MARKLQGDVADLVQRAQRDAPEREHRYVYGDTSTANSPGYAVRPNKKAVGRRISTFYLVVLLLGFGVAIVAYINNIIAVNRLSAEINLLQTQLDKISNTNAVLQAEINRKAAWERIGNVASHDLGLKYPKEQPIMFDVDENLMDRVRKDTAPK
jgi:cell division protein FtsL